MSDIEKNAEAAAAEAEAVEAEARSEADVGVYVHTFKTPFTREGKTIDHLTFRWDTLTGRDHCEIENEMLRRGLTLVTPEFSSEFLSRMAVRACEDRDEHDIRILSRDMLAAMPIRDFQTICKRARAFLLRAGL